MDNLDAQKNALSKGLLSTNKIAPTIPKSASVADNVAKITSQDSPLMQQAKTQGLQTANRRGLLNSSIAVGAAQNAVIQAATPIASQDASIAANSYEAGQDRALSEVQQQRSITSQEGMQQKSIDAADTQQIRDIDFRQEEAAKDRTLEETLQNRSFDLQEQIAKWNLDSNDRNAAAQFLTNMETMYNDRYAQIMANTSLSSSQRSTFLKDAAALRDKELNFVEQLYNVEIQW